MKPDLRRPLGILRSLLWALLIAVSAPLLVALVVYATAPPRADPDPAFLVLVATLTLGPSILLGRAVRRARMTGLATWDLGPTTGRLLMVVSILVALVLGLAGLYPVVRLLKLTIGH
jgi:hypothetical protein